MLEQVPRGYFEQIWETGEGFRARCPKCGEEAGKFYWNEEKQVGCCHHLDCDWHTSRGGVTLRELRRFLGHQTKFEPQVISYSVEEGVVKLPKEFKRLSDRKLGSIRYDIYDYLESRGLEKKLLDKMQVGYCASGCHWGYIVFPVFGSDGEIVYWQGRRYKDREPKFYNPQSSSKKKLLYWIGAGQKPRRVVLVESIINALTLESWHHPGTHVVALMGKNLSQFQLDRLSACRPVLKEVVVALDSDAWRDAVEMARAVAVSIEWLAVRLACVSRGDLNTLGSARAWRIVENARIYKMMEHLKLLAHGPRLA